MKYIFLKILLLSGWSGQKIWQGSWQPWCLLHLLVNTGNNWPIKAQDYISMQSISQSQLSFMFWCVQGVWVWVTLLPTLILNTERRDVGLGSRDYLGYGLWLVGFMFEVVADMQKSIFRANPENDVSRMKYQKIFDTKIFAGQVHLLRTVVSVSSSKLLWWDTSLVWTLLVSINCLQRWQ